MPAFDASAAVEALDWDFTGHRPDGTRIPGWPKQLAQAKGTIPEPSDAAIGRFLDGLKKLYAEAQETGVPTDDDATPGQMLEAVGRLTGDAFVGFMAKIAELFGELCGEHPSKDILLALPLRARVAFYGWIQAEVVNPEAGPGAGTAQVSTLRSAAAG